LSGAKQLPLGTVGVNNVVSVAKRVSQLLVEHGEVAVFIDTKRMVRVALHHEAGYDDAFKTQGDFLVGRYQRKEDEPFKASLIADDILDRLIEIARRCAKARA
jgi:hypothetical protein